MEMGNPLFAQQLSQLSMWPLYFKLPTPAAPPIVSGMTNVPSGPGMAADDSMIPPGTESLPPMEAGASVASPPVDPALLPPSV